MHRGVRPDVIVINLKKARRHEELAHGSLYIKIQRKMTESMLANYNRWVFEHSKSECDETLRQCVNVLNGEEESFQTMPVEFDLQSIDDRINARISA